MFSRIRAGLTYANVMATIAVFVALGGGAIAATGLIGADGKIRGCVSKKGQLTVLKGGQKCKRGQTAISWNQTGPAGQPGSAGATGPKGETGEKGDKGDTGPSTGPAGGDLTGSFPDPVIKPGAVTAEKVSGNTLTGAQVNESTLGKVPSSSSADAATNAQKLGGLDPAHFEPKCPPAMFINTVAGVCADNEKNSPTFAEPNPPDLAWVPALQRCRSQGKRLPTVGESALTLSVDMWTDAVFTDSNTTYAWVADEDSGGQYTVSRAVASAPHPFRCVTTALG